MVHVERVRRRGRDRRSRAAGQRADQRVPARDHEDVAGAAAAVRHAGGARLSAGALAQLLKCLMVYVNGRLRQEEEEEEEDDDCRRKARCRCRCRCKCGRCCCKDERN